MSAFPEVPPEVIAALAKENRSPVIIGLVAGFTGLAFVCVLLRFFSRAKLVGIVGLEDYFIAVSMVSSTSNLMSLDDSHYLFLGLLYFHIGMPNTRG
jgi:hypothetical protein